MTCPLCSFQDGLRISRTQAQVLLALYASDHPVSDQAVMRMAGRLHDADAAKVHVSHLRKILGSGAIVTVRLAGWSLSPAMRLRCEALLHGSDQCDTLPRRLDGLREFTQG